MAESVVHPNVSQDNENFGSIGSIEIDYDSTNNRVKGWIIGTEGLHVLRSAEDLETVYQQIDEARYIASTNNASRIALRLLVERPSLVDGLNGLVEAVIPMTSPRMEGLHIAYIGSNDARRLSRESYFSTQWLSLKEVLARPRRERSRRSVPDGYTVEELAEPTEQDTHQVINLMKEAYSRDSRVIMWYRPTFENVSKMLRDSVGYIARDREGSIVSMSIAEGADLEFEGRTARMYEISDCATSMDHRSRGLLQACITRMLNDEQIMQADCVYTEARIAHTPINIAFHNLGFECGGVLRNACYIGGSRNLPENSDIETLVASYMPRRENES